MLMGQGGEGGEDELPMLKIYPKWYVRRLKLLGFLGAECTSKVLSERSFNRSGTAALVRFPHDVQEGGDRV
jgi:hypothetical protein